MTTSNRSLGPGFRALFHGTLVTNTGDGIRLAAVPLLAVQLTPSPLVIASVTAAQYLPWVTFAPVGGVAVDRWDRRRLIVGTQASRGLVAAVLAVLVLTDAVAIWHLCVVAFVITAGEILVDPAIVALVPSVVDDEHLDTANGRIAGAEIITNDFAGGPVGAAAFAWVPWLPFVMDAASYLGSTLAFSRLPTQAPPPPTDTMSVRADARAGFDFLRAHPLLGPFTLSQVVYYFGVSSGLSMLVVLAREVGASAFTFGVVLAAGALGAFGGSLAGSRIVNTFGRRTTLAGAVVLQGLASGLDGEGVDQPGDGEYPQNCFARTHDRQRTASIVGLPLDGDDGADPHRIHERATAQVEPNVRSEFGCGVDERGGCRSVELAVDLEP